MTETPLPCGMLTVTSIAGSAVPADLVVRKQQRPANGQRQQYHQHQQDLPTAFLRVSFSCAISTFLLS